MANTNTLTRRQYEDGRLKCLGASELDRTSRHYARIRINTSDLGAYALQDYVRVTYFSASGEDFEVTTVSIESGETRTHRVRLNGFLYRIGTDPNSEEDGYFTKLPEDEWDDALEELIEEEVVPAPIIRRSVEPQRELALPVVYNPPGKIPRRWLV